LCGPAHCRYRSARLHQILAPGPENFPHLRRYLVAGGSQHAPDEHVLAPIRRDGLQIMAGLFRDVGKAPGPSR
jgi:hypothetical protein